MPNDGDTPGSYRSRILVCGWAGAGNIGDELLTEWVVRTIGEAGGEAVVTSRDPADTRLRHPAADVCRWGPRDLGVLRSVDAVIVGPGGIIQDRTSLWSLPGHLLKAIVGRRRALPVAAVGIGAETMVRRGSHRLLREALGDAVAVITRDEPSATAIRQAGVDAEAAVDLVFDLEVPDEVRGSHLVVALGPRVGAGRLRPARSRLVSEDPEPVAAAITGLARRLDAEVVLACFRGEGDARFARDLADAMGNRAEIAPGDPPRLRRTVAGARAVVASRYHAVVLAVAAGVPAIVKSDQTKLTDLVAQVGDDRQACLAPDWRSVSRWDPPPVGTGSRPGSVDAAREAVSALIQAASRRRSGPDARC